MKVQGKCPYCKRIHWIRVPESREYLKGAVEAGLIVAERDDLQIYQERPQETLVQTTPKDALLRAAAFGIPAFALSAWTVMVGVPSWITGGFVACSVLAGALSTPSLKRDRQTVPVETPAEWKLNEPPPVDKNAPLRVEARITEDGEPYEKQENWQFCISAERAASLARQYLLDHKPFSERELAGPGRVVSGPQFRKYQAQLLDKALMVYKNKHNNRGGVVHTRLGLRMFQALIETYPG